MWVVEIKRDGEQSFAVFDDERLMCIQLRETWGIPLEGNLAYLSGQGIHGLGCAITLHKVEAMNWLPEAVPKAA